MTKKSFTLIELLITVAIIAIVAVALLVLLNPKKQIEKAWDARRKSDLATLKKALEDYYNDKNCYPTAQEICYDDLTADNTCHICGSHPSSPNFSPYLTKLPCDPQYPSKNYLYQINNETCPSWHRIYTQFSNDQDLGIKDVGCSSGCGPAPLYAYSYGASSPNIDLEVNPMLPTATPTQPPPPTATPTPQPCPADPASKFCRTGGEQFSCNDCGFFANCNANCSIKQLYSDTDCLIPCYEP